MGNRMKSQRVDLECVVIEVNDLPKILLRFIFNNLKIIEQSKCREVCKKWKKAIKKPSVLKFLFELEDPWIKSSQRKIPLTFEIRENHPQLTINMRRKLVEWFSDVQQNFEISERAFYLGIEILDRLLGSSSNLSRNDFQLFGIVCLWIASKYEDTYTRSIKDLCEICDNTYNEQSIILAERTTLNIIGWELYGSTIYSLAEEYLDLINFNQDICNSSNSDYARKLELFNKLPHYINFLVSVCYFYSKNIKDYTKKQIATSVVFLSLYILDLSKKWPSSFTNQLNQPLTEELTDCIELIFDLLSKYISSVYSNGETSIFFKFSQQKYEAVSRIPLPLLLNIQFD